MMKDWSGAMSASRFVIPGPLMIGPRFSGGEYLPSRSRRERQTSMDPMFPSRTAVKYNVPSPASDTKYSFFSPLIGDPRLCASADQPPAVFCTYQMSKSCFDLESVGRSETKYNRSPSIESIGSASRHCPEKDATS